MATEEEPISTNQEPLIENLSNSLTSEQFQAWYRERQYRRNIENGKPYFNGPSTVSEPERHSPSKFLQCHRKVFYQQENAPEEKADPNGIFWFGTRFEEEIAIPFLREAVAGLEEYVTNSIWVDFTVETEAGELKIKGETDPVIVDSDGLPLLLTEIKTKRSVDNVQSPNSHHQAQAHAYMKGLSEKYDRNVSRAVIIYGGRTSLDMRAFTIDFDPWFWRETALDWAQTHTTYRVNHKLPPATPEYDWECEFCSYRKRCGQGSTDHDDSPVFGLLPGVDDYPREKLTEYLAAHEEAKLTPILANVYPELAEEHGVFDWQCTTCSQHFDWNDIDWQPVSAEQPTCPCCSEEGSQHVLSEPGPEAQRRMVNNCE